MADREVEYAAESVAVQKQSAEPYAKEDERVR